jgi:hypothetical protein
MSATRTNKGKPNGIFMAELGAWNLCQTAENRFKVYARDPVNGKANYAFGVKSGALDSHAGLDITKLRDERPELYKSVETYFKATIDPAGDAPMTQVEEEMDPYGDLALSRRRRLTPEQNWKRGLLQMRRVEMEHAAAKKESVWESAVRMLYAANFKARISDVDASKAVHWIMQRQGGVDLKSLLEIETNFYSGKYGPMSSTMLEQQLDLLATNSLEFDNEEMTNGSTDGKRMAQSAESTSTSTVRAGGTGTDAADAGGISGLEDGESSATTDIFSAFQ